MPQPLVFLPLIHRFSFSSPSPAPPSSRVNVYLCIKQALFIRPMNMHCFAAVARCRVQTRRYHCLINHTQFHRPTLCTPLPPFSARPLVAIHPSFPRSPLLPRLVRIVPVASSLALSVISSLAVSSSPPPPPPLSFRSSRPAIPERPNERPQLTLIYVIFFRDVFATCRRVTAHPRPTRRAPACARGRACGCGSQWRRGPNGSGAE